MFGKRNDDDSNVPQTISDKEWDRITRAAAAQTPSPLDPDGDARQDAWSASARNSAWN
jgi:hypothetical protein